MSRMTDKTPMPSKLERQIIADRRYRSQMSARVSGMEFPCVWHTMGHLEMISGPVPKELRIVVYESRVIDVADVVDRLNAAGYTDNCVVRKTGSGK